MSDVYTESMDALHGGQRASGLGAGRLGRLLGVSPDMMKSLLTSRRRPALRTVCPSEFGFVGQPEVEGGERQIH